MAKDDDFVDVTLPSGAVARVPWVRFLELVQERPQTETAILSAREQAKALRNAAFPPPLRPRAKAFLQALVDAAGTPFGGLNAEGLAAELELSGVKSVSGEVLTTKHNMMEMGLDPHKYFSKDENNIWRCVLEPTKRLLAEHS